MKNEHPIAIVGDVHWGVRNDSKAFIDAHSCFFAWLHRKCCDLGIKHVIFTGDFFDRRKGASFDVIMEAKAWLKVFDAEGINVVIIAGNHDCTYVNTNRINSIDAIFGDTYPSVTAITTVARTIEFGGRQILFLPWINRENVDVAVKELSDSPASIVVGHLELAGFEYHRGVVSETSHVDKTLLGRFSHVFSGHYHSASSQDNIRYVGTPYAMTWADYGETKGFTVLHPNDNVEFIRNPETMFHRFEYDDRADTAELISHIKQTPLANKYVRVAIRYKRNPIALENVLAAIEAWKPADLSIMDETTFVEIGDSEDLCGASISDTATTMRAYVEDDLTTDLDKEVLKRILFDLYVSAQNTTGE